jgi:hypothetical protein
MHGSCYSKREREEKRRKKKEEEGEEEAGGAGHFRVTRPWVFGSIHSATQVACSELHIILRLPNLVFFGNPGPAKCRRVEEANRRNRKGDQFSEKGRGSWGTYVRRPIDLLDQIVKQNKCFFSILLLCSNLEWPAAAAAAAAADHRPHLSVGPH